MVTAIPNSEDAILSLCDYAAPLFERALNAKTIVELGVGQGLSTQVFLHACSKTGGHLYSVDIVDCPKARLAVANLRLEKFWTFTIVDDVQYAVLWHQPIDLLFIDSSHTFDHTLAELNLYSKFVKEDGIILMHDTVNREYHGVIEAIKAFQKDSSGWQFTELLPNTIDGLGELKRRSS